MKIDTGTQALLCRVEDGVATITLNRPEARNALGEELTPALRGMIKQVGDDPEVGAVLITGAGTASEVGSADSSRHGIAIGITNENYGRSSCGVRLWRCSGMGYRAIMQKSAAAGE